jgi:hypothetical protein
MASIEKKMRSNTNKKGKPIPKTAINQNLPGFKKGTRQTSR